MKRTSLILIISLFAFSAICQNTLKGRIVNQFGTPLEYASIGVLNKAIGTITEPNGTFILNLNKVDNGDSIRFSMIGYAPQCFGLSQLLGKENTIVLHEQQFSLNEVIVKPGNNFQIKGNKGHSWLGKCCGWGGTDHGKGSELGGKVSLGEELVRIDKLRIRVMQNSFDSSLFRLHIRNIVNNKPGKELLHQNIYLPISIKSGWVTFDLKDYSLVLNGDVAVTIEWVKVIGVNAKRLARVNKSKEKTPQILLNVSKKNGCLYRKWAHDDSWTAINECSPSIYLIVK